MFGSFNAWRSHEMDHRREWFCPMCHLVYHDKLKAKMHIKQHYDNSDDHHVDLLLQTSSRLPEYLSVDDCPFCDWSTTLRKRNVTPKEQDLTVPTRRFMKHLGKHLEEFALFVVPQPDEDDENLNDIGSNEVHASDAGGNDSVSTLSSFRSALSAREGTYARFKASYILQPDVPSSSATGPILSPSIHKMQSNHEEDFNETGHPSTAIVRTFVVCTRCKTVSFDLPFLCLRAHAYSL
jgi:hypothetical protein